MSETSEPSIIEVCISPFLCVHHPLLTTSRYFVAMCPWLGKSLLILTLNPQIPEDPLSSDEKSKSAKEPERMSDTSEMSLPMLPPRTDQKR